jgi:hypothetical protein
MEAWADLLQAIAALLWPAFAFTALFAFRHELRSLIERLRKGKLLGQEIELEGPLVELRAAATAAVEEVAAAPRVALPAPSAESTAQQEEARERVLNELGRSSKAALLVLASEIEKAVRLVLESNGWSPHQKPVPVGVAFRILSEKGGLPPALLDAVSKFADVRNRLVHGHHAASEDDVVRAVDSGLQILEALQAVPHSVHTVYHPGAELYSDPDGHVPRDGLRALILDNEAKPGKGRVTRSVHPTSRTTYAKDQQVAW